MPDSWYVMAAEWLVGMHDLCNTEKMPTLWSWQKTMIEKSLVGLKRHGCFLNASDMGTGKTRAACGTAKLGKVNPLIVCPKNLIPEWENEAKLWGLDPEIVNYEKIRGKKLPESRMVIWDEAHRLKSRKSQQAQLLIDSVKDKRYNLLLSGTIADNPMHMRALGYALRLHDLRGFWKWMFQFGLMRNRWGGMVYTGGVKGMRKLHRLVFPEKGVRIKYRDIPEFPELFIAPQLSEYRNQAKIQAAYEKLREQHGSYEKTPLTDMIQARMISELLKTPETAIMANDALAEGYSVCIFVNFVETVRQLLQELPNALPYTGEQTSREKTESLKRFQNNEATCLVATVQSGGPGINLGDEHGGHPRLSLISPTWEAQLFLQACRRTHRGNSKSPANVRILFAKDTVEERVWQTVKQKSNQIQTLNDDDLAFR